MEWRGGWVIGGGRDMRVGLWLRREANETVQGWREGWVIGGCRDMSVGLWLRREADGTVQG